MRYDRDIYDQAPSPGIDEAHNFSNFVTHQALRTATKQSWFRNDFFTSKTQQSWELPRG